MVGALEISHAHFNARSSVSPIRISRDIRAPYRVFGSICLATLTLIFLATLSLLSNSRDDDDV